MKENTSKENTVSVITTLCFLWSLLFLRSQSQWSPLNRGTLGSGASKFCHVSQRFFYYFFKAMSN